jgi:hypothetical protein
MIDVDLLNLSDNGWVIWMGIMGLWTTMQILIIVAQATKDSSASPSANRPRAFEQRDSERDENTRRRSERR